MAVRLVLCVALASGVGCVTPPASGPDEVACALAEPPPEPRASRRSPELLGGLEGLRIALAGPPGSELRRGEVVAEVLVSWRLVAESVDIARNTSAVPDSVVRAVLTGTRWSPSDSRFTEPRKRCRIRLRLDRTDDGVRRDLDAGN